MQELNAKENVNVANQRNDKIWAFNVGTNRFEENPKWLFLYIHYLREDIDAYWFSDSEDLAHDLREQGFNSFTYKDPRGFKIKEQAGVLVTNQVKEVYPMSMKGAKYLNLWHGVGTKALIERSLSIGTLAARIAKKYIRFNQIYMQNQLFLATSPAMEEHFKVTHGLDAKQIVRAGYPRCKYKEKFDYSSYDHNLKAQKGLSPDAKIVLVAPTYRDKSNIDYVNTAFPDMKKLIEKLEQENILMIFKMHPIIEKSIGFMSIKERYADCPNLIFWDNNSDVYEIFDQIDAAVIDYSSIYYDLLSAGVTKFIRYIFDFDIYEQYLNDYMNLTTGEVVMTFDSLIEKLNLELTDESDDQKRIKDYFWSYDTEDSFDQIIESTLNFKPDNSPMPTLYSFDIFDTLIARKVLHPFGIFYYVENKIRNSELNFPEYFTTNYEIVRRSCEANVREYYRELKLTKSDQRLEITFEEIFERMQELYQITDAQKQALIDWELEGEYENIIPMPENIQKLKDLVAAGEDVVLISDMYLNQKVITKLLAIVDEDLTKLPLYLSAEQGVQKSTGELYTKIFYDIDYKYGEWIHYGDNAHADGKMASNTGIKPEIHEINHFNEFENNLINNLKTYDAFLVSKILSDERNLQANELNEFAYSLFMMATVPYVNWLVQDALEKEIKTLYFIAKEGHYLKMIADKIIAINGYNLRTKAIYGSQKAWCIPSFTDEVDAEFYSNQGNFKGVDNSEKLLNALEISKAKFLEIFPELEHVFTDEVAAPEFDKIKRMCEASLEYNEYLLELAHEQRHVVKAYLKQEIDFTEKHAFIEYWSSGYTQTCLNRIINDIDGVDTDTEFYYARSIYKTAGRNMRYNFTSFNQSLELIEEVFAHVPYESVTKYQFVGDEVHPVINEDDEVSDLHTTVESVIDRYCEEFLRLNLINRNKTERELFVYAVQTINANKDTELVQNALFKQNQLLHELEEEEQVDTKTELPEVKPKITSDNAQREETPISGLRSLKQKYHAVKRKFKK